MLPEEKMVPNGPIGDAAVKRPTFAEFAAQENMVSVDYKDDVELTASVAAFKAYHSHDIAAGIRDGLPMILDVHKIDQPGLNAFALACGDADVIGINRDTLPILQTVARVIASHNTILSLQVTAGMEPENLVCPISPEVPDFLEHYKIGPLKDPRREWVAGNLYQMAVGYILNHEFKHIYSGHCDYVGEHQPFALISERPMAGSGRDLDVEDETLEWDADSTAIERLLIEAVQPESEWVDDRTKWTLPQQTLYGPLKDAVGLAVAAVSMCGALFAIGETSDFGDVEPRSHPHPEFRIMFASHAIQESLAFRTGQPLEMFETMVTRPFGGLLYSWIDGFPASGVFRASAGAFGSLGQDFQDAYNARIAAWEACWAKMHPKLDLLKRGGRLAPPELALHPAFPNSILKG